MTIDGISVTLGPWATAGHLCLFRVWLGSHSLAHTVLVPTQKWRFVSTHTVSPTRRTQPERTRLRSSGGELHLKRAKGRVGPPPGEPRGSLNTSWPAGPRWCPPVLCCALVPTRSEPAVCVLLPTAGV